MPPDLLRDVPRPSNFLHPRRLYAGPQHRQDWFGIRAAVDDDSTIIDIYDEIGMWGSDAASFIAELRAVTTPHITLNLSSLGGDVFDGLAIYSALVHHPARVTVRIDGVAASIASVIAQAGDLIVISSSAKIMIHDAWAMIVGNAGDMRAMAEILDATSDTLADIYRERAGSGTRKEWRAAMQANLDGTWYSAAEAVEVGLADEVAKAGRRSGGVDPVDAWAASSIGRIMHTTSAHAVNAPDPDPDPAPVAVVDPDNDDAPASVTDTLDVDVLDIDLTPLTGATRSVLAAAAVDTFDTLDEHLLDEATNAGLFDAATMTAAAARLIDENDLDPDHVAIGADAADRSEADSTTPPATTEPQAVDFGQLGATLLEAFTS